jgi:uncharacterized CHY-type Zn-finger protein
MARKCLAELNGRISVCIHFHDCLQQDLAAIAGKPLDRYQVNFKDEQRAKMHAFAVLRSSKQGQSVLRHTLKMGRCAPHTTPAA